MRSSKSAINQFGEKKNKQTTQTTIGHLVTFKDLAIKKIKAEHTAQRSNAKMQEFHFSPKE